MKRASGAERRPRAGGEILQPRADRDDYVGVAGERVRRGRADHADRPDIVRVVVDERGAAGDRLGDRQIVALGEIGQRRLGQRIAHAAAGDDERLLRLLQKRRGAHNLAAVGALAADVMDARLEEGLRIVEGKLLRVLAKAEEGRPALGRVEHHRDRLRQRGDDLLRMRDAVPVARHRLEGVVHGRRRIAEMLDLLQHRVGAAVGEDVAGEDQDRQPVGHGAAGGGDHVAGARADRGERHHDLPAPLGLGEADRGERHRLLVLSAPGRELVLHRFQRLRQAGDVAVAEDGEEAGEERDDVPVDLGLLVDQIAHQRLRHGQANGLHSFLPGKRSIFVPSSQSGRIGEIARAPELPDIGSRKGKRRMAEGRSRRGSASGLSGAASWAAPTPSHSMPCRRFSTCR